MSASKRVGVLLSGGVDSSVSAFLLKKEGYDVVGLTGKMFDSDAAQKSCQNASDIAKMLNIPHYICDLSMYFNEKIIQYFLNSYKIGVTPNPCIMCNFYVKWGKLLDFALNDLNVDFIATGHYADIKNQNGIFKLYPAKDEKKDQLYYLFELTQKQLSRTLFPLSNLIKTDIKKIAYDNNLPSASAKESQDICFISKTNGKKEFIKTNLGIKKGKFILQKTNEFLGFHDGIYNYTIGQRKGIGIAYSEPLYVSKIDAENDIVYLAVKNDLYQSEIFVPTLKFQSEKILSDFEAKVKIRYNMPPVKASIIRIAEGYKVKFETPVCAVAKGQALVAYDSEDNHLICGTWI